MKYSEKINSLRFVAIFLVLLEHFASFIGGKISAGYYGVDLFFVISGFLITFILVNSNEHSFFEAYKKFLGRRALRIFPIYYLTLLVLWLLNTPSVREYLSWLIFYGYNYALISYKIQNNPVEHFWSLCVEEQFYLFWPLIVLSTRKNSNFFLLIVFLLIIFGFVQMTFDLIPSISKYNYVNLLTRMSSLGVGGLGVIVYKYRQNLLSKLLKNKQIEIFSYCFLFGLLFISFKFKYVLLPFFSIYFVLKAFEDSFLVTPVNRFLGNKLIIYIGTISYGIYIFHLPIGYYAQLYLFDPLWSLIDFSELGYIKIIQWHSWLIKLPLFSILSFLMARFSYEYIEKPCLALKDKFFSLT